LLTAVLVDRLTGWKQTSRSGETRTIQISMNRKMKHSKTYVEFIFYHSSLRTKHGEFRFKNIWKWRQTVSQP